MQDIRECKDEKGKKKKKEMHNPNIDDKQKEKRRRHKTRWSNRASASAQHPSQRDDPVGDVL